jgi:hypothetical protein
MNDARDFNTEYLSKMVIMIIVEAGEPAKARAENL